MKKNGLFLGMLGMVLAFGLLFIGCEPEPELGSNDDKYTVTFNANGGTVTPASVQVISDKAVGTLPKPTKEDTPNIFWGWFTGNGTENGWGDFFTESTVVTADITVYARWGSSEPTKYTVTFIAGDGNVIPPTKEVISGDAVGTLQKPTNSGHIFGGWYTAQNGGGIAFITESIITGHITVYAKWTATEGVTITDAEVCDWNGKPLTFTKTFTHYHGMGNPEMKTLASAGISDFVVKNGKLNATLPGMPTVFESNAALITKLKITKMLDPDAKIFFLNALRESVPEPGFSLLYYYRNGNSGDANYYIYSDRDVVITGVRELTLTAGWNISDDHPYRWTYDKF